jgi:hypothetical protein
MVEDMYKTCKWCKYYKDGFCIKESFNVLDDWGKPYNYLEVNLEVKEPDKFNCSEWE